MAAHLSRSLQQALRPLRICTASAVNAPIRPFHNIPSLVTPSVNIVRTSGDAQENLRGMSLCSSSTSMMSTWSGSGTQEDFMLKDTCIIVDDQDKIIGHSNKHSCHRFVPGQPTGMLHRAFSVFLFDQENRLLLQQRAKSKVTFPSVWTNTCCSHPLHGQVPNEVDMPEQIADGSVPGIKHAAVRKLQHELGIPPEQVPLEGFKFLTRLHYCAADIDTWGPNAEWGENEVDYILFTRPAGPITLAPNPEEIDEVKWVTPAELKAMMDPSTGLRWSPWFRIIAERFLDTWWNDMEGVMSPGASKHLDVSRVHSILGPQA